MSQVIYPASDDLVVFEGDVRDEKSAWEGGVTLKFSNGASAELVWTDVKGFFWKDVKGLDVIEPDNPETDWPRLKTDDEIHWITYERGGSLEALVSSKSEVSIKAIKDAAECLSFEDDDPDAVVSSTINWLFIEGHLALK